MPEAFSLSFGTKARRTKKIGEREEDWHQLSLLQTQEQNNDCRILSYLAMTLVMNQADMNVVCFINHHREAPSVC